MLRLAGGLSDYQPLLHVDHHDSDSESTTDLNSELSRCHRIIHLRHKAIFALCALIVFLVVSNLILLIKLLRVQALEQHLDSHLLYCELYISNSWLNTKRCDSAPAQEAVQHEVVKFHAGPLNNEKDDIYSLPPSPEVDEAWRDLYESKSHLAGTREEVSSRHLSLD